MTESISRELLQRIPAGVARRYRVIPKKTDSNFLVLLTPQQPSPNDEADLAFLTGGFVSFECIDPKVFEELLIDYCSRAAPTLGSVFLDMERFQESESRKHGLDVVTAETDDSPVKFVDAALSLAIGAHASDVHFEPTANSLVLRVRIDGVLQQIGTANADQAAAIVSRAKLLAKMDVAEKRRPQDGRFTMSGSNKLVDIRVSSLPAAYGEKIVMRLLDSTAQQLAIDQLGMNAPCQAALIDALSQPQGIILVTGPTGSGKTTTLYACLRHLATTEINATTIEDPKEYDLPGVNQSQVRPEIGYTFATALRSILRQDPDVIMVGEIRDTETARIAIRAALTGHLVLSTLHTNDAISTIDRLVDMGIEPYLVASSLNAIISQRLVRLACRMCSGKLKTAEISLDKNDGLSDPDNRDPSGCVNCRHTGYLGRQAVFELLRISGRWREAIRSVDYRRSELMHSGELVSTLAESARELVNSGDTTEAEVLRVLGTSSQ